MKSITSKAIWVSQEASSSQMGKSFTASGERRRISEIGNNFFSGNRWRTMADQTTAKPKTQTKTQLKHPKQYQVLLHNEDFTPREFVVHVLEVVFHKGQEIAVQIMWQAHQHGVAVVGSYSLQEAETKVDKVHEMAQQEGYPLKFSLREL